MTAPPASRRAYLLAALAFTILAIYGSLVPLRYTPLAWDEALARFRNVPYLTIGPGSRADWVSNILLFVPLTYLWTGVLTLNRRHGVGRWLIAGLVVSAATAMSVALEFTQLWFPPRTVSQNDMIAETIGAAAGALLWLGTGHATAEWLGRYTRHSHSRRQVDWLLELYFVGFLIYSVLPLDLTISAGELFGKFRDGRVTIVPFSDIALSWVGLYGVVRDIVVFVPIGMLLSTWRTRDGQGVRSVGMTLFLGTAVAIAIESAQIVILSRYASSTDVVFSALGAALGSVVMRRWHGSREAGPVAGARDHALRPTLVWSAAVLAWVLVLIVIFCGPFEVSGTREEWRARYEQIWKVPFASLYYNTEYNAVSDVLRKMLMYGTLGALSAITVGTIRAPRPVIWLLRGAALAGAAGVAGGIELAQVFLPPHVPDITDVLIGTVGAAFGMLVALRVRGGTRPDTRR